MNRSGYSIFVIRGVLPSTYIADSVSAHQFYVPKSLIDSIDIVKRGTGANTDIGRAIEDSLQMTNEEDELEKAIQLSFEVNEEQLLREALKLSLEEEEGPFELKLRLLSGQTVTRRFAAHSTLNDLYEWANTQNSGHVVVLFHTHSRTQILQSGETLEEAGFTTRDLVTCESTIEPN